MKRSSMLSKQLATLVSRALLAAALLVVFGASEVLAQAPSYAEDWKAAMQTAKEGRQIEEANYEQAVVKYEEAYKQLASVAEKANQAGDLKNADKAKMTAAKLAYMAGMLLHNNGSSEAAAQHFQAGLDIAPSYQRNRKALQTVESSQKQSIIVEASRALRNGSARQALGLLEQAEDSGDKFFYMAEAYSALNELSQSISYADQALNSGDLSASKTSRMYLLKGEVYMKQGNKEAAIANLQRAKDSGGPQIRDRAQGLLVQLGVEG